MKTILYNSSDIDIICEKLISGEVISFPTDTVYGVGVIYDNFDALNALKKAKIRPEEKAIPTMVYDINSLKEVAALNENALKIAKAFMPGPITLVLPKRKEISNFMTSGKDTIGVRIPNDDFILKLIEKCGKPILVSSANISGGENCFTHNDVLKQLDGRINGVVKGMAGGQMASTIIDMTSNTPVILREGKVSLEEILEVIKS